ncbi:low affinity iron permease family protein [Methylocapsa palsarum]|uniref:Low affinity Fe/Cu permease n=1 Tax=Methylocapsa palsarum TaxID=1612308 RepID=A0A1I3XK11_9HYPH|nr:low affinity iron permease family protein [Methylocapsa palsarum]SFK19862.1 Low affinity Fe/Cu permease [Methylocapsa palsarum]
MPDKSSPVSRTFSAAANLVSKAMGKPAAFVAAALVVVVWAAFGPVFHYSDTWQLVINTGTTIVTFLMVFLIQNSQNRDNAAIQVKLDELIRASAAKNVFMGIEQLTDDQIARMRDICEMKAHAQQAVNKAGEKAKEAADQVG